MKDVLLSPIRLSDLEELIERAVHKALRSYTPEGMTKDMLTLEEACEFLGLKRPTVYALVSKREIPHSKSGKKLYFSKKELDSWMRKDKRKTRDEIRAEVVIPQPKRRR